MGNRLKKQIPYLLITLVLAVNSLVLAYKPEAPDTFTEVRKFVCEPLSFRHDILISAHSVSALGPGPYVEQRISGLKPCLGYRYREKDRKHWRRLMLDERANMLGRLCAAYFLMEDSQLARDFVERQLKHENRSIRRNAGRIVELYADVDPRKLYVYIDLSKMWDIDSMIRLLDDESLDDCGIKYYICRHLGKMKVEKATAAIHRYLKREPDSHSAVEALVELDPSLVIPKLMEGLKDRSRRVYFEIECLVKLKHKPAVPVLLDRLNDPPRHTASAIRTASTAPRKITYQTLYDLEDILLALRDFGDKRAIEPIEKFLDSKYPEETKVIARRVLMQLKESDPVPTLLKMLDSENDKWLRNDIVQDLGNYRDRRVVVRLERMARTSPSAYMRRGAIDSLAEIGNKESFLALATLLSVKYSNNLNADGGWKFRPNFSTHFPKKIFWILRENTNQNFGMDHRAWKDWISRNVE